MILDTNAVSALFAGEPGIEPLLRGTRRLALPAIVLGEYRYGLERSKHREQLEPLLDELIRVSRTLPIDAVTARHYAEVREELRSDGAPIPENDVWIAASCRQHRLPLVTRDRHFDRVRGLRRLEW